MNEQNQFNQQNQNQAQNQKVDQAVVEAAEFKTVVNGKVVSINQAQAVLEAQEASVKQSGIQQAHDNSTEPVQAGQKAQGQRTASSSDESARQAEMYVKQVNVQSGQKELEQHMNQSGQQAQSEAQKIQQEAQQSLQQSQSKESQQATQQAQSKAKAKNQGGQ